MANKTEKELQDLTGVKPKGKEDRQAYLRRLCSAVGELDDKAWKGMSTPAQKWSNAASNNFDADKDIADFEGAAEAEAPSKGKGKAKDDEDPGEDAEEDDETQAEDADGSDGDSEEPDMADKKSSKKSKAAPAKPSKAAKPEPKAKAKAEPKAEAKPKAKAKADKKPRGNGAVQAVMNHVLKSPDDSVPDVIAALKKQGVTVTPATASSARGFFKLVVRFLQDKKLTTKKLFD